MFNLVLTESKVFKSLMKALQEILPALQFKIDKTGMHLQGFDRSRITFVDFHIKPEFFDVFEADEETIVSLDSDTLYTAVKRVRADDVIEMTSDETNLILKYEGASRRTFKIAMIELEDVETRDLPEMDWLATVEIPIGELDKALLDVQTVSTTVTIKIDSDKIYILGDGNLGKMDMEFIHGAKVKIDKPAKSNFNLLKLKSILKVKNLVDEAKLSIGDEMPLKLELGSDDAYIGYLVAPYIEAEQ